MVEVETYGTEIELLGTLDDGVEMIELDGVLVYVVCFP